MSTQLMTEKSNGGDTLTVQSSWGGEHKGMCIDLFIQKNDWSMGGSAQYRMDRSCAENLVKCIQFAYQQADEREAVRKIDELKEQLLGTIRFFDSENQWISDNDLVDTELLKDKITEIIG